MSKNNNENQIGEKVWEAFHNFHFFCDAQRFRKIFAKQELVKMISDLPGNIIDAGVFKGTSTILFAHLLEFYQPNSRSKVLAFDFFSEEFPGAASRELAAVVNHQQNYEPMAYDNLISVINTQGLSHRIKIIKGDITKTLPDYFNENPGSRVSLLHCDLDIYHPTLSTLQHCWPRIVKGGLVACDEYGVDMWEEANAVDEFLSSLDFPPKLSTLPNATSPTAYFIKDNYGN